MKATPLHRLAAALIAGVWIFHGRYSKILGGIPAASRRPWYPTARNLESSTWIYRLREFL